MNAGREMDKLVAVHVCGYTMFKKRGPEGMYDAWLDKEMIELRSSLPEFSKDLKQAWELVVSTGLDFKLTKRNKSYIGKSIHDASFIKDGSTYSGSSDESASHAICVALLVLVGYEVEI